MDTKLLSGALKRVFGNGSVNSIAATSLVPYCDANGVPDGLSSINNLASVVKSYLEFFPYRGAINSSSINDQTTVSNFGAYIVGGTTNNGTAFQGDGLLLVGGGARLKIAANGKIGRYKNGTWEDL